MLTDWNPLDYSNALWASPQCPQSPLHDIDTDVRLGSPAATQTWSRIPDSQHTAALDTSELPTTGGLPEQVIVPQ